MKGIKLISIVIILTSMFACEPLVTFNEPQPTDTDNLLKFPKRLQGEYLSLEDNSTLIIGDKLIQRIYDYNYKTHLYLLDSNIRLINDTMINLDTKEKTLIKQEGDSLIIHVHYVDTIFQINNRHVLRKFKGYYFLNTCYSEANWEVKKMQLSKGQLIISSISTKLDVENLKEITETNQDTLQPYRFQTTKKQFKEFIKNDGFSITETFVRQY